MEAAVRKAVRWTVQKFTELETASHCLETMYKSAIEEYLAFSAGIDDASKRLDDLEKTLSQSVRKLLSIGCDVDSKNRRGSMEERNINSKAITSKPLVIQHSNALFALRGELADINSNMTVSIFYVK